MVAAFLAPPQICRDHFEVYDGNIAEAGFCDKFRYEYIFFPIVIFCAVVQLVFIYQMISTCILKNNIQQVFLMENKANSKVKVADSFGFWLCKLSSIIYAVSGLCYIEYMKRWTTNHATES